MQIVFDFLDQATRQLTYPRKGSLYPFESEQISGDHQKAWQECYNVARSFCTVAVEVHLGLTTDQERQLFHDLNNLGKRVDKNLALTFDNSNPINLFIKHDLHETLGLAIAEKDSKDWNSDDGAIAWKDLVAVNAILFLNKTNIGGATPPDVNPKIEIAKRMWEAVMAIPNFGEEQAKQKTVAAQPVILKAIAKLIYDLAFSPRKSSQASEHLDTFLAEVSGIDFSHDNPMWRYYEFNATERAAAGLNGLADYLPAEDGANRDIGAFQAGVMRFGAKHNDIFPLLGDMLRWKLGLPSRRA